MLHLAEPTAPGVVSGNMRLGELPSDLARGQDWGPLQWEEDPSPFSTTLQRKHVLASAVWDLNTERVGNTD